MRFRARHIAKAPLFLCGLLLLCVTRAYAVDSTAFLSGNVTRDGQPIASASVRASGNNITVTTTTDSKGHFQFSPLPVGTYDVSADSTGQTGTVRVDLGSGGASVAIALSGLKEIASVVTTASASSTLHGSGSDVVLNRAALTHMPYANSFSEMEIQLPGAVRGANGVVHMNGDHGVINYMINGVPLPQELNRDIGGEINLNDLSFIDLIEGAYPAQYGLRFGSVFDIATRAGTGPPGFDGNFSYGSYNTANSTIGYHSPIGERGGYDIALSGSQTSRGLDPPDFDSPHNNSSSTNQFARFALPAGQNDFTNVTVIHGHSTFQIPNDTQFGEPATTDDNETQDDLFLSVQRQHILNANGSITVGPAFKASRIQDFGDPVNDFIFGEAVNVNAPPFGNGGSSSDCANAISTGVFGPTTCAFSLADTRTALDYIFQADYAQQFGNHMLKAGSSFDNSRVLKDYAVTLQPNNFISSAPVTVVDNSPNIANTYTSYIQDSWRVNALWQFDYGMRYDFFTIKSDSFDQGFGSFSPRLKVTRSFGSRANVYGYVGRFFEPFSFENVSPQAAQQLNLPLQPTEAQFDLKPERDTQWEFGGHVPVGSGDLGFRVWQKNANDLIDDTQVGVTLLHQDINYQLGRLSQQALNYTQPLRGNGKAYFSIAHVVSLNKGCETQLLAPCFGSPTDFTPADHEQRYSIASGILLPDRRGGWFSMNGEYGSGLSSASCPPGTPGYCKRTPHTTFNVEEGIAVGPRTALTLNVQNLFNDRYYVTLLNAQGNHYAAPREFNIGLRFAQ